MGDFTRIVQRMGDFKTLIQEQIHIINVGEKAKQTTISFIPGITLLNSNTTLLQQ